MRKTYTVVMYENGTDVVAERTYTNKKAAFEMAEWYMERRYEREYGKSPETVIRKALRETGVTPFIVRVKES